MANSKEYYLDKYLDEIAKNGKLLLFIELVAAGPRSDGTYNYCREALEFLAEKLLQDLKNE